MNQAPNLTANNVAEARQAPASVAGGADMGSNIGVGAEYERNTSGIQRTTTVPPPYLLQSTTTPRSTVSACLIWGPRLLFASSSCLTPFLGLVGWRLAGRRVVSSWAWTGRAGSPTAGQDSVSACSRTLSILSKALRTSAELRRSTRKRSSRLGRETVWPSEKRMSATR